MESSPCWKELTDELKQRILIPYTVEVLRLKVKVKLTP
jgi:hypothetical protein